MPATPTQAVVGGLFFALIALIPASAAADLVLLTNGRTIQVEVCLFEGDTALLIFPGGGEVRTPR